MAIIISLSAVKKAKARLDHRQKGDENATKFGRSKAEKALEKAQADKARTDLDSHARKDGHARE